MTAGINHLYQSYILRLWWVRDENQWRASLQDIFTKEIVEFSEIPAMAVYIYDKIGVEFQPGKPQQVKSRRVEPA